MSATPSTAPSVDLAISQSHLLAANSDEAHVIDGRVLHESFADVDQPMTGNVSAPSAGNRCVRNE